MKNGYMFFFNMGAITAMSRIFLVVGILGMINWRITQVMFWVCAAIAVVCFVLNLFHSPTDKDFLLGIEDFQLGFKKELQNRYGIMSMDNMAVLNGFVKKGRMFLKRCIDRKMIYPHPSILAAIELHGELQVYFGHISMMKKSDPEYVKCTVDKDFSIENELGEDERTAFVTLKCKEFPKGVTVVITNDYHLRDFLDKVSLKEQAK